MYRKYGPDDLVGLQGVSRMAGQPWDMYPVWKSFSTLALGASGHHPENGLEVPVAPFPKEVATS